MLIVGRALPTTQNHPVLSGLVCHDGADQVVVQLQLVPVSLYDVLEVVLAHPQRHLVVHGGHVRGTLRFKETLVDEVQEYF